VWAAPFVVSGETAQVEVVARGLHHQITVRLDRIAQQPVIDRTTNPADDVKTGTVITIHWPGIA
jgi:TolB-like protein